MAGASWRACPRLGSCTSSARSRSSSVSLGVLRHTPRAVPRTEYTLAAAPLRGLEERGTNCRRHFYGDEALGREEVVLPALIDHSNLPVPLSILIEKRNVN